MADRSPGSDREWLKENWLALFEFAPDAVHILDADGNLLAANPAFCRLLGCEQGGEPRNVREWDPNWSAEKMAGLSAENAGAWGRYASNYHRPDGSSIPVEVRVASVPTHSGVNYMGTVRDTSAETEFDLCSQIVTNMAEGVALIRAADGEIVYTNDKFESMFGYGRGEMVGRNVSSLNAPDGRDALEIASDIQRELFKSEEWSGDIKNIRKDGSSFWCHATVSTLDHSQYGRIWVAIHSDINERKLVENALRESEEKFKYIFEYSALAKSITLPTGEIYVNRAFSDLLGYSLRELQNKSWREVTHVDDIDLTQKVVDRLLSGELDTAHFTKRYLRKDGAVVWADVSTSIRHGKDGKPMYFMTSISNITERMLAEEKLSQSHQLLTNLARLVPGVIYQYRLYPDGRSAFPYASPGMNDIYEVTPEEVQEDATPVFGRLHPEDYDRVSNSIFESARTLQTFYCEFRVILPRQGLRWRWSQAQPERTEDGGTLWYGIISDITERKQAEVELRRHRDHLEDLVQERTAELMISKDQAEAANRAKSDFLAVMSHEIRTPLNGVLGMAHLILQTDLTGKQRSYLTNLKISGETLMATINDILDFSRIESGKLALEQTDFDLDNVLRKLSSNVAYRAQEKGLELVFNTGPDVPRLLVGDPSRISQVLMNLVGNAIKFSEAGEVVVRTRLLGRGLDNARLEFSVRDTGIGMTAGQLAHLFQPFSQADSSTSRKYGGSGLGLTICQRLVQLMGGEIQVESSFGLGSVFTFTLELGCRAGRQVEVLEIRPELDGRSVLVVDDNAETLEAIRSTLESFACRVTVAQTAESGLALLAEPAAPYELVFMDWSLPGGIDGQQAIGRIKHDPLLKHIPAILLVSAEEMVKQAENMDMDGYLIKPVTRSQLLDAVMQALVQKNPVLPAQDLTLSPASGTGPRIRRVTKPLVLENLENLKGGQILLVEDNEINQIVALEMLHGMDLGLQVSIANSGEEALEMVDKNQFDAILMDIQMPGLDGYETTAHIRADARFAFDQLPVIAMTANAMAGDREKAIKAGMNDYVSKPINMAELISALARWVKSRPVAGATPPANDKPGEVVELQASLAALDMDGALMRLGGNKELYLRLARMFRAGHAHAAGAIRAALQNDDPELARRLAHTLKGVAGTVGAELLRAAARKLEVAIKEGRTAEYDLLLADVEKKLAAVMALVAVME